MNDDQVVEIARVGGFLPRDGAERTDINGMPFGTTSVVSLVRAASAIGRTAR